MDLLSKVINIWVGHDYCSTTGHTKMRTANQISSQKLNEKQNKTGQLARAEDEKKLKIILYGESPVGQ